MATVNSIKSTSYPSFGIGRRGITIYQGNDITKISAKVGDIFVNSTMGLSQYDGTNWVNYAQLTSNLSQLSSLNLSDGYLAITNNDFQINSIDKLKTDLNLGSSAYLDVGTSSGNIPTLDSTGKINSSLLPSIAVTTVTVVNTEDDKPTSANEGDIVIVTDTNKTYICSVTSTTSPTWVELVTTSSVTSVNNITGNVTLTGSNITSSYSPKNFNTTSGSSLDLYITGIDNQLSTYVSSSSVGDIISYNVGNTSGNIPSVGENNLLSGDIIPQLTTVTLETSSTNTFPENARKGDILINSNIRSSFVYDGTTWDQFYLQNLVSVNGLTGSTNNSGDGIVTLDGSNINGTYTPTNFTLPTSGETTLITIDSYFKGIDNKLSMLGNQSYIETTVNGNLNKVDTSSSDIEITANGNLITQFTSSSSAGEKLLISNDTNQIILEGTGADNVDIVLRPTGSGVVKLGSETEGSMTTDAGIGISIKPGTSTSSNGANVTISGGDSSETNSTGGNIILSIGSGTTSNGDIQTNSGFIPSNDMSITNKLYVDNKINAISQITSVDATNNITATLSSGVLTITGPDLTKYLSTEGGTLTGTLIGTDAEFSGTIYAKTQDQNTNDTSVATTAFVQNHPNSFIATSTYINLPSTPTIGMMYLVTNGCKPGEASGSGTGVVCVYDGSIWMDISSAIAVTI